MITTVVIVAGGDRIPPSALDGLPEEIWVIAADSGLEHARRIGLAVELVVGDFDSVSETELAGHAGEVERHPTDKDATDLELALRAARRLPGLERIVVLGGHGGRLDHLLANATTLSSPELAAVEVEWRAGPATVRVVHKRARLIGGPSETVTLLPIGGPVTGVTTRGLKWELDDETIEFGSSRGVSNLFRAEEATVTVRGGVLLAIQPGSAAGVS